MKIILYAVLLCLGLPHLSHAQTILGRWSGEASYRSRYGTTNTSCERLTVDLKKNERNELTVSMNYDCYWSLDWSYSFDRVFAVDKLGNLLGEDGSLQDNEFHWNNIIAYTSGSEIRFTLNEDGTLSASILQAGSGNDEARITGRLSRDASPLVDRKLIAAEVYGGAWTGIVTVVDKDPQGKIISSQQCPVEKWQLNFKDSFLFQTHFYLQNCAGEEHFSEYFGPFLFEYGKVFTYPLVDGRNKAFEVLPMGTYDDKGFQSTNREGYGSSQVEFTVVDSKRIRVQKTKKYFDMTSIPFGDRHIEVILDLQRP